MMLQNESEKPPQAATRAAAAVMLTIKIGCSRRLALAGQVHRQSGQEPARVLAVSQVDHQQSEQQACTLASASPASPLLVRLAGPRGRNCDISSLRAGFRKRGERIERRRVWDLQLQARDGIHRHNCLDSSSVQSEAELLSLASYGKYRYWLHNVKGSGDFGARGDGGDESGGFHVQ